MQFFQSLGLMDESEQVSTASEQLGVLILVGFCISLLLSFIMQLFAQKLRVIETLRWAMAHLGIYLGGTTALFAVLIWLMCLTGSFLAACLFTGLITIVWGATNRQMLRHRDLPLLPQDLRMALQLSSLAAMLSVHLGLLIAALIGLTAGIAALCLVLPQISIWIPARLLLFFTSSTLIIAFFTAGKQNSLIRKIFTKLGANFSMKMPQSLAYNGYLAIFFTYCRAPLIERPDTYCKEKIAEIAARYTEKAALYNASQLSETQRPNLIFIMSESFSDPTRLPGLSFSEDPIPTIRKLMRQYPSGTVLAPGFGGGTAHCEFEALTGFSVALCGGISPFENAVCNKASFPSVARDFKQRGYKTIALHPYHSGMYARPAAYKAMGFDQFYDMNTMQHKGKIDRSSYISDANAYKDLFCLIQESETPSFIHLVTMQNHGGYTDNRFDNTISIEGFTGKDKISLETYIQGLRYTDRATGELLEKLATLERDTVVVFWGDHLPIGYPNNFTDTLDREKYTTPYFIWSKSGQTTNKIGLRSPLFFQSLLAELEVCPISPFIAQLHALEQELHGIHQRFLVGVDNKTIADSNLSSRAKALLEELLLVQYDTLLGENYCDASNYFNSALQSVMAQRLQI